MTHRGPNERGTYLASGIALGARRLSIVDVSEGHQPAVSEDGRVRAIQNGELYNHLDLRRSLGAPRVCESVRHGGPAPPLRGVRERVSRASAGQIRNFDLGRGCPSPGPCARSARCQAALLCPMRDKAPVRVRAEESAGKWTDRSGSRLRGDRRVPDTRFRARASHVAARRFEAEPRQSPDRGRNVVRLDRYWSYPEPGHPRDAPRGRVERGGHRARGVRSASLDERRAARSDALGRPRQQPDRRADGPQHGGAGEDVLDRFHRRRRRQRAR